MDSHELIDAQFDRAVEIIQSLPKTGPIQTDYEEKLTMYRCGTISHAYTVLLIMGLVLVFELLAVCTNKVTSNTRMTRTQPY